MLRQLVEPMQLMSEEGLPVVATETMAPLTSAHYARVTSHMPLNARLAACLSVGGVRRRLGQATLPLAARPQLHGTHGWSVPQHLWPLCRRHDMHVLAWKHAQAAARRAALAVEAACAVPYSSCTSASLQSTMAEAPRVLRGRAPALQGAVRPRQGKERVIPWDCKVKDVHAADRRCARALTCGPACRRRGQRAQSAPAAPALAA